MIPSSPSGRLLHQAQIASLAVLSGLIAHGPAQPKPQGAIPVRRSLQALGFAPRVPARIGEARFGWHAPAAACHAGSRRTLPRRLRRGAERPDRSQNAGFGAPKGAPAPNRKGLADLSAKPLKLLAPGAGFEPATNRLTVDCSTAELSGTDGGRIATTLAGCKPFATQHAGKSSSSPRAAFSLWLPCRFRLRRRAPCGYRRRHGDHASVISRKASWRSGYAEDCKSLHPGSIPGEASNNSLQALINLRFRDRLSRPASCCSDGGTARGRPASRWRGFVMVTCLFAVA